ncbi:MAG: anaerobic ribonucleoside-triphosphate reductase, partial [Clostridia bacterium]
MFKKIKKRSGHLANFDRERIKIAFVKAGQSTNEYNADMAEELTKRVLGELQKEKDENGIELPTVEQVQDIAEIVLMRSSYRKTAKEYIIYRHKHKEIREVQKLFSVKTVDEYINGKDWRVRENANTTFSLQGLNNYVSSGVSGNYWLYGLYPAQIRDAHLNGDIHIHDLSSISSYCVGWDLYDFLQTGFTGVPTKISSKPPSHFESALGQIVNFFYTCQGESAGAQAFANFDTLLAPFIRKDCLSREDVKKSMRSFFFNCNIPTRTGFQTPFINVTLDFTVPNTFKDIPVIIGGKPQESTYKEYQNEMTLFNDVFFEVALEGDAYGRVFTFPIPTINITKDFDYNKCPSLWKAVVKYGLPYFANFVNSDMDPSDARSMCLSGETFIFYKKENKIKRKEIREVFNENKEENIEVLYKGNWINARPIKTTDTYDFYKIVLRNGSFFVATDNHLHLTSQGYKKSFDLREGDFLPISIYTNKKMYGNLGSYDFGRFLGLYLAEGSTCGKTKESLKDIQFSLGEDEQTVVDFLKNFCSINFGIQLSQTKNTGKSISLFARSLQPIINSYIIGKAKNKRLINWWRLNKECLEGLLFGWIEGDGSDMKDANTSSEKLAYQMLEIGLYIGYPMSIRREYIKSILNEKQYEGYNYVVQICKPEEGFKNDRRIFHKVGEYLWTKIVSIEKLYTHIGAYCVEVIKEKEPLFELSNRIITHNCCRLRIDNRVLQKRMGGLFNAAPLTGSIGVTTLNAARIGYESNNEKEFFNNLEQKMNISKDSLEIKRKA